MEWSTYPNLPPIAPSLFFTSSADNAVLLSQRIRHHLKRYRGNSATFKEIMKIVKRLSNENGAPDEQEIVAGIDTDTPICKAKLSDGTNLVYQVDQTISIDGEAKKALKLYGVFPNDKVDKLVWERVARRLTAAPEDMPSLDEEQDSEVHELTHEKFVPYSESLMKSLWVGLESAFIFDLSRQEQEIINHPSSCYVIGRSGTGKTTTMLFRMLMREKTPHGLDRRLRQVFVTQSKVLAARVQEYYRKLEATLENSARSIEEIRRIAAKVDEEEEDDDLMGQDDEDDTRADLPERYSLLGDEHFPLFLTFNQLCRLLEADNPDRPAVNATNSATGGSTAGMLSFDEFVGDYWSKMNPQITRRLNPALVWSEMMGVIRGSEGAVDTADGYISESAYLALSHKAQTTFARYPEDVYRIFELYLAKRRPGVRDAADRTHSLLKMFSSEYRDPIDFLYVDEVQDNMIIDTRLLRTLCPNPHGFFWAGDTAQTISVECTFRFADLTASLYRIEEADPLVQAGKRELVKPKVFQLSTNYRSHAGIVNAASSVVDILIAIFPKSIDRLDRETSLSKGPLPTFFANCDDGVAGFAQFLRGKGTSAIPFGAEQCIIVRSSDEREMLRNKISDLEVCIMTPYEAKGLEFNDVLLYNFFTSSHANDREWSVVLDALHDSRAVDQSRYAILCSELKCLYVALTRARNNLWIWDSGVNAQPMKELWLSRQQIRIAGPNESIPRLGGHDSSSHWRQKGREIFLRKSYHEAMLCFERAKRPYEAALCRAYLFRSQARRASPNLRNTAFADAAKAFLDCARMAPDHRKPQCNQYAGDCFSTAQLHEKAGDAYKAAGKITASAQSYRKAGNFKKCSDVIRYHRSDVDESVAESLLKVCRIGLIRENKLKEASALVESQDEFLEVLEDYGSEENRIEILQTWSRYAEAAESSLKEGDIIGAVDLFLKQGDEPSHLRAISCVLAGLWKCCPLGASQIESEDAKVLLDRANSLNPQRMDPVQRAQLTAFQAIASGDKSQLRELGALCSASEASPLHHPTLALLCLDAAFDHVPPLHSLGIPSIIAILDDYYQLGKLLRIAVGLRDACARSSMQQLLGFQVANGLDGTPIPNQYTICKPSPLNQELESIQPNSCSASGTLVLDGGRLSCFIRNYITKRLHDKLFDLQDHMARVSVIELCVQYAMNGHCSKGDRCSRSHDLTSEGYNQRIRVYVQQVMIMCHLASLPRQYWLKQVQRMWLQRFYGALYPVSYNMGNIHNLLPHKIPNFRLALGLLRHWMRNQSILIDKTFPPQHYMNAIITVSMLISKLDLEAAPSYLWMTPSLFNAHRDFIRDFEGGGSAVSIVQDLFCCLVGDHGQALRRGISFVRHILEKRCTVSIHFLLPLLEKLVAHALVEIALQRSGFSAEGLHGLTLPRSWIVEVFQPKFRALHADTGCIWHLRQLFQRILITIFENPGGIWYDDARTLDRVTPPLKDALVLRVCRTLVLIGYNQRNTQTDIFKAITTVPRNNWNERARYTSFILAPDWYRMTLAMRSSMKACDMDELIQLHDCRRPGGLPLQNTRRIIFRDFKDLHQLVAYPRGISSVILSVLSATAVPYVPHTPHLVTSHHVATTEADLNANPTIQVQHPDDSLSSKDPPTVNTQAEGDDATEGDLLDRVKDVDLARQLNEVEKSAATRIADAFNAYKRRREISEEFKKDPVRRYFADCMAVVDAGLDPGPQASREYVHLFRGPLPHILSYIETVRERSLSRRDDMKRQSRTVEHEELESIQELIGENRDLLRAARALMGKIKPSSKKHQECSVEWLRGVIMEVRALDEQACRIFGGKVGTDGNLIIGAEVILQQFFSRQQAPQTIEPTPKRPARPSLNVEDVDM
ncbi:hypothetical protein BOTBODRAFT_29995 [Botryobasidium botryosum FD-172 SS1]|uniref:UvrD-like helicase ATP-binding domain-containing protein n=1 Tax=Botryobasidium botryosum (strain FD-172 SS1) TaxID=930990 RepID=A0A067N068_BOTB1|nr:hypothetical protein BOTBODRAFT_29995 [Botryobasidium botryosum FD-172 SS1]